MNVTLPTDTLNGTFNITILTPQDMINVCNSLTEQVHILKDDVTLYLRVMLILNVILAIIMLYVYWLYVKGERK